MSIGEYIPSRFPTSEDILARILAEATEVSAGENEFYVKATLEVSDDEMELIREMLDEIEAIRQIKGADE